MSPKIWAGKGEIMARSKVLMYDKFESLKPGPIREVVDGPFREMHAQPADPNDNLGGWSRRVGNWDIPYEMYKMVETPKGRFVESVVTATVYDNASIAKGDYSWRDVQVEGTVTLLPLGKGWGGPAGIIFRFMDSQRYYAAVIDEDGMAKILRRVESSWDTLAAAPCKAKLGQEIKIRIEARGAKVKAVVGGVKIEAEDAVLPSGMVGFIASRPARFGPIKVTALGGEAERLAREKKTDQKRIAAKRKKHGKPVVWKKFDTKGFGSGRRIRLGDLDGDGELDFVLIRLNNGKDRGLGCLTAMSSDGKVMWRLGELQPDTEMESSGDAPVQINDIDGDGRNEVVCAFKNELMVLDGATGKLKYKAELPKISPYPQVFKENILHWGAGFSDEGPHMVPSAICFADLAGRGVPRDVLLLDHYHLLVAMDPQFKELWRTACSHGHFPLPYDFDGKGREDVLAGYHHMSPDGKLVGRVCMQDHQDAIYAGPLDAEGKGPVKILMSAGEDGLLTLTPDYDIRQRVMGHVQRLAIARFREDLPGLCIVVVLYHGNMGIMSLFDSTVKKVWTKDFPVIGTTMQPVNWDGSGIELMFLTGLRPSQGYQGGLMDGFGDLVVPLPDDGGPGICAFAHDFDRDGLDELMLWDRDRIWIYHNEDDPPKGLKYRPIRPPLHNMSNFQSYYSRPNWGK